MRLGVFSGQKSVCRVYENCDRSNVLASITVQYRLGFLFSHCLMARRIFSTFAFKLSSVTEASKVDEKRIPRILRFTFFIGMLLCFPVSSFLVPNQMLQIFSYSVGGLRIRKNSQQCLLPQ